MSKQSVKICFYCMKNGYTIKFCRFMRFFVPKGLLKWVPKVPKVPVNNYGPTFIMGPNFAS